LSDRISRELELFHDYKVQEIAILDPIFNFDERHYLPILQKIRDLDSQSQLAIQARFELLTRPHGAHFLDFIRTHSRVKLEFGVQTFNKDISRQIQRNNHTVQLHRGIQLLHEARADFDLHLIFGLPGQKIEDFWRDYELAVAARPNRLFIFPLNVLRGTKLEHLAFEKGYVWDVHNHNTITRSPWMTPSEVLEIKDFSTQLNQASKGIPYGERIDFSEAFRRVG